MGVACARGGVGAHPAGAAELVHGDGPAGDAVPAAGRTPHPAGQLPASALVEACARPRPGGRTDAMLNPPRETPMPHRRLHLLLADLGQRERVGHHHRHRRGRRLERPADTASWPAPRHRAGSLLPDRWRRCPNRRAGPGAWRVWGWDWPAWVCGACTGACSTAEVCLLHPSLNDAPGLVQAAAPRANKLAMAVRSSAARQSRPGASTWRATR